MGTNIIRYVIDPSVEAFTAGRNTELPYEVIQSHQIHGDGIAVVNDRNTSRGNLQGIDALITNLVDCPIAVRTADCVPILLYDPVRKVVAAVHSGWRGTVLRIVNKVIVKMNESFGSNPNDLYAVIGPSICVNSFSVHDDVKSAFVNAFFPMDVICKPSGSDTSLIDLWKANKWLLETGGVKSTNIQTAGICTFEHHDEFYSARYEHNNKCGRNINAIRIIPTCKV